MNYQVRLDDEIIVDSFAGGGGASTGIETGLGVTVSIAINHDPSAILMHKTNHPYAEHYQASVWDIDPVAAVRGRKVALAWFSPDCKHFSRAKGAALVSRNIRGLAWIALRWAGTVRPRVIMLENVPEFQTWGPVRKGKPVKKLAGTTFSKFIGQLRDLGYTVEWRELVAADYGAPTIRKRLYLVARCDGKPIAWPEPTHSKAGGKGLKKWRAAAECIDFSLPCPSIFAGKEEVMERHGLKVVRPLSDNTLRRIIRGVDKFTITSGKPFIVQQKFQNAAQDVGKPLTTVTAVGAHELCNPVLAPFLAECNHSGNGHIDPVTNACKTITAKHTEGIVAPCLIQYHTEQPERVRAAGLGSPINTVDAANRYGLTCAHVVKFKVDDLGHGMAEPLQTVTASAGEFALCKAYTARYEAGQDLGRWPLIRDLLNRCCGYTLAKDEVLLLDIDGVDYFIADIGLRMLTPRELYKAMGFPPDYIIDRDYKGRPYPKSAQVARCGNAVCPPVAAALARANLPEYAKRKTYATMKELTDDLAM